MLSLIIHYFLAKLNEFDHDFVIKMMQNLKDFIFSIYNIQNNPKNIEVNWIILEHYKYQRIYKKRNRHNK